MPGNKARLQCSTLKNDFTMSDEMTPPETIAPDMMPGLKNFHIECGRTPQNKRGGSND